MLSLTGCQRTQSAPAAETSSAPLLEAESALARYLLDAVPDLGDTREQLVARLGAPDSASGAAVANRHDPLVTDSVLTLHFPGVTAMVHKAGYDGREMLAALHITDARHMPASAPVGVGSTAADVLVLLGPPDDQSEGHMEFTCAECMMAGHETVRFVLQRGLVSRVELRYWVD